MSNLLTRAPRITWRLLGMAALGLSLVGGFILLKDGGQGAAAASAPGPVAISADLQEVLPGTRGELIASTSGYNGEGQVLAVEVPRDLALSKISDPYAVADAAWRVRVLAADLAAEVPGVTGYQLTSPGVSPDAISPAVVGELTGTLPPPAATKGLQQLGAVSPDAARAQLESNIAVLRKATSSAISSVTIQSLSLPDADEHTAFAIKVESGDVEKLRPFMGDIFVGLQTGLVGSEDAVIDGLAIVLSGGLKPVAGSWIATRALTGAILESPGFPMPGTLTTTLPFSASTGGPTPRGAATLGATSEEPQPAE
jgi:hypothetical protein